jgi:hypothetical protein
MVLSFATLKLERHHKEEVATGFAGFRLQGLELALVAFSFTAIAMLAALGWFIFPAGDSYHWSQLYYWRQHESIAPFFVHNARITTFSFLPNAIFYPVFVSTESVRMALAVNVLIYALAAFVCFDACRKLQMSVLVCLISVGVLFSSGIFLRSVLNGGLGVSLWILFSSGALSFLVSAITADHEKDRSRHICKSIWLFCLSIGCKNVSIFGLPIYAAAVLWVLRKSGLAVFVRAATVGLAALIAGGVVWNYAANVIHAGGVTGGRAAEISQSNSLSTFWTGNIRGLTGFLDLEPLPFSRWDVATRLNRALVRVLGGSDALPGETPGGYYSYDGNVHGTGLGVLGLLIFLPSIFYWMIHPPPWWRLSAFAFLYLGFGFVLAHGVLRWGTIGLFRLLTGYLVWAAPLMAHFLSQNRFVRFIAPAILFVAFAYQVVKSAAMTVRMTDIPRLVEIEQVRSYVYKYAETATLRQAGVETTIWIRQPGTGEEYRYLEADIDLNGKRVGYLASGNSADHFLMANWGAILMPIPSVEDAGPINYLVVEDLAESHFSEPDEWSEVMSIRRNGHILLAFYTRRS